MLSTILSRRSFCTGNHFPQRRIARAIVERMAALMTTEQPGNVIALKKEVGA
jgi:hypothetical protein